MLLDDLLARRLVFLSGKGGVGKSAVGAALALAARERGKRVLLAEVESPLEAARYLGSGPVGSKETEVLPGISTVNFDSKAVMAEFVERTVPLQMLARRILDSPVYHRFFEAAPGLPELMLLGKIMVLTEGDKGQRPYDLILVDAPATGHGLAFLKVPLAASEAIPVGPVGNNARRILKLLRDARRTALVIVAIPEEMAVVEAVEFHALAREQVGIHVAGVVLNGCHERRFTAMQEAEILRLTSEGATGRLAAGVDLAAALEAGRRHIRRRKMTAFYQGRLRRAVEEPVVSLPYLFQETLDLEAIRLLAQRLIAA